tara:strand:+ start:67 stop:582 length:516 start_codon:yes stop_codon:yes gene_type:complete
LSQLALELVHGPHSGFQFEEREETGHADTFAFQGLQVLVADEDVEQTQVVGIGIGMLYSGGNDEGVAGLDGMATALDDMGALAIENDDQFDKIVLVQGSIPLIIPTANRYALVGDLEPGSDRLIAVVCPDFFLRRGNIHAFSHSLCDIDTVHDCPWLDFSLKDGEIMLLFG